MTPHMVARTQPSAKPLNGTKSEGRVMNSRLPRMRFTKNVTATAAAILPLPYTLATGDNVPSFKSATTALSSDSCSSRWKATNTMAARITPK